MDVNVSQISEYDGLTIQHVYAEGEPRLTGDESRVVGRTGLNLHASRDGDKVRLVGSLSAAVEIDCDRCLIIDEGRTPTSAELITLYLGGGGLLLVAGIGLAGMRLFGG